MKRMATVALMIHLGVAGLYAQDAQEMSANVKMTFSGTMTATTLNLRPDSVTDEVDLAGDGSLGPFTFRELHTDTTLPPNDPPATCAAPLLFLPVLIGGGVLRFHDGSLLVVNLTDGSLCINFEAQAAQLIEAYEITGGTKRFKHAAGNLRLTATVRPVFGGAPNMPVLLTSAGKLEGTVFRMGHREEGPGGQ